MPRWQPWDVIGGAYSDDTRPWSVQDTVNYLVVMAEKGGTRSPKMLRGVPGMVTFSASMPESPVRGLYVAEGRLFAVVAQTLYAIGTDGAATSLGTIPGVGRCVFTHNQVTGGNQVVIGNGQSGYVYDTVAGALVQITDDGFPGFRSVDFIDQYIVGVEPFGRYWFHSDLADATSYSALDRAEAEKAPDRIQQAIVTGSDVLVLGERTGQFFANTGAATGTFQNRPGTELNIGAASPWTACRLDNTVYWLGNDGSVYRLAGYQAQRISTHALEQAISRSGMADAYAFTFEDQGHKCYLLTFPDGQTWCFDAGSGEWTRRESYGLNRWRVSALVRWGQHWIAGDYVNGRLYQLDWRVQSEAGEPLERRRVNGVLHDDQNRLIVNGVELLFDTGMGSESHPFPDPITPVITLSGSHPDGMAGEPMTATTYATTGGVLPLAFSIVSGSLPTGRNLDASSGEVTGTPSTYGAYAWTVRVTDGGGTYVDLEDNADIGALTFLAGPSMTADELLRSESGTVWADSLPTGTVAGVSRLYGANNKAFAFVTASSVGRVTSDAGLLWTSLTGLPTTSKLGMTYAEHAGVGRYLVFMGGGASAYSSTDAVSFSAIPVESRTYYGAAAIGGTVVVLSTLSSLIRSTDGGQNFGAAFSNGIGQVEVITTTEDAFLACGTAGVIIRSPTGAAGTWTLVHSPGQGDGLAYGMGRVMWLGTNGATAYSDDGGLTWTAGPTIPSFSTGGNATSNLAYGNGLFVAVGDNRQVYTTPATGTPAWTQRNSNANPSAYEDVVALRVMP